MNENPYMELDFTDITAALPLSRRNFLRTLGGGIIILFWAGDLADLLAQGREYPKDFNAYLKISADGKVTCFSGKIEMGQGIVTSLAQMLAEELDVNLDAVQMVMGDTSTCPWDMGTWGSMSTRFFGPPLRAAGAEARLVLLELASERLSVPLDQLTVENGVIFPKSQKDKKVTFGQLAEGKNIVRHAQKKPPLKTLSEFKVIGKTTLRRDALEKVTGKAQYAGDVRLPGMVYARILRPPSHGAKLKSLDISAAEKLEGVTVIHEGDLVAVLHKNYDEAGTALEKIKATFEEVESPLDDQTIFDHLLAHAGQARTVDKGGNLEEGFKMANLVIEQKYLDGYVAHAPIETHTALAKVEGQQATLWISTQAPFLFQNQIAAALGFPAENVRIITPFVGGGFGGKAAGDQAMEAARLAKLSGKPVQVTYTRAEEFFYDTFRPAAVVKIKSGLDQAGKIVAWDYEVYCAGDRGGRHFYDIPHHRTASSRNFGEGENRSGVSLHPFRTGAWRGPGVNTNTFARESHIDILAAKAGIDPVEFRLRNLKDERMIRVLKTAAEKFGWTPAKSPSGRGLGVACGIDSDSYVAHIAQVDVDKKSGKIQVKRVVCAQDMGLVINPEGALIQIEGCITMGLGYALAEHIRFKGGKILDSNFDTYQIPRFSWLPKIEAVLIKDDQAPAHGGGEPAIICMGALIANAVFDAVGARLTELPFNPDRVKKAMNQPA
jgi:nicotinate dehydrogenase subunit B